MKWTDHYGDGDRSDVHSHPIVDLLLADCEIKASLDNIHSAEGWRQLRGLLSHVKEYLESCFIFNILIVC